MSDASSPQVRDHERREKEESEGYSPHGGNERTGGTRRGYRTANARERDNAGLSRKGERQGVKDRSGVGEDQTSRRATGWSLPALLRVSSFSSQSLPAKRVLTPLFFSLPDVVALSPAAASSFSHLYYSYFHAHVLRLCGSTIYVLSDLPLLRYRTTDNRPQCLARNCSTESCIDRPDTCCLGISSQ